MSDDAQDHTARYLVKLACYWARANKKFSWILREQQARNPVLLGASKNNRKGSSWT